MILLCADENAAAQPSRFEAPADLFYLHPLVNYQLPLSWQSRWERERLRANGVQATVGSISTKDFTTLVRVDVNAPAHDHLRLAYRLDWTDSPHLDGGERQDWLGLELGGLPTSFGRWGVEVVAHPPSDKTELDLVASLVWTDATRENYLRVGRRTDDFLFEEKNRLGAVTLAGAHGPAWVAHGTRGRWTVASEGTVLNRQERAFPRADLSPDLARWNLRRGWSSSAVRFAPRHGIAELRFEHRDFEDDRFDREEVRTRRESAWRHVSVAYESAITPRWSVRAQVHRMHFDDDRDDATHRRRENLGGLFVERALGRGHAIDVGVMTTHYSWTTKPVDERYGPDREGTASKLGLGWTYALGTRGWFRATLSHEPDPQKFGGANLQAQMNF